MSSNSEDDKPTNGWDALIVVTAIIAILIGCFAPDIIRAIKG